MTRPSRFTNPGANVQFRVGGYADQPPNAPAGPDCCEVDETELPDRAAEDNGAYMVALASGGGPTIVQSKWAGLGGSVELDAPGTPGNTLIMLVTRRDSGEPGDPPLGGFTTVAKAQHNLDFQRSCAMWYRVVTIDESGVTGGGDGVTYLTGAAGDRGFLVEITGQYAGIQAEQNDVASTTAMTCGGSVTPDAGVSSLLIGVAAIGGTGGTITEGTDSVAWVDELVGGFSPYTWMGYRPVASPSGAYTVGGTQASTFYCGVTGVFEGSEASWSLPAPNAHDDDDATYHTITGTDLLRVDLGGEFRIVRTRIRIAATNAGARTFTIKGANEVDFSDEVTVATVDFTATGSLTAQDVEATWYTEESYRYFELSIDDSDTYRVHSWELFEATLATSHEHAASTIPYDNTTSGLTADDVQDAIDELAESIGEPGPISADDVDYDNAASGGSSADVQGALDELYGALDWAVDTVGSLTDGTPATIVNDSSHNVFPGLVRLDAARVLVVYRRGTSHEAGGDIYGQVGTLAADHASVTSWGTQFLIYSNAEDVRLEDGVSIIDDQLVIAARLYDGTDNHDPFLLICDDAPADFTSASTWSSPIAIPLAEGADQNYSQGHVHKLQDGSYIVGAGHDTAGLHEVGIWKWTGTVDDPSGGAYITVADGADDFAEIAIEELPDGDLRAMVRSVTDGNIQTATSSDEGDTWSAVAAGHDGYGYPAFRHLLSTLTLTVYRDAPNGDTAWRSSSNEGSTWGSETILDTTGTRSGYASILQLTPTRVLVAYAVEYAVDGSTGGADIFEQVFTDSSTFGANIGTPASTVEDETTWGIAPAVGTDTEYARQDHTHGTPAEPTGGHGPILLESGHSVPFTFDEILQESDGSDFLYASA